MRPRLYATTLFLIVILHAHNGHAQIGREVQTPTLPATSTTAPQSPSLPVFEKNHAEVLVIGTYRRILSRMPTEVESHLLVGRLMRGELNEWSLWDEVLYSKERREYHMRQIVWSLACFIPAALLFGLAFHLLLRANKTVGAWGFAILATSFGVVFLAMTLIYSVNIPFWDDYDAVLAYLCRPVAERPSPHVLVAQHNEHRIAFTRLSVLADYLLLGGQVDFRLMALIGALPVLGAGALLCLMAKAAKAPLAVVPIALMGVFSMRTDENITWGMSSTQHSGVMFFGLLCLYLWGRRSTAARLCALAAMTASSFSSPSGVLLCPVLISWVLLDALAPSDGTAFARRIARAAENLAKEWRHTVPLLLVTLALMAMYFNDYHKPSHHPSLAFAAWNPWQFILYALYFMGSWLQLAGAPLLGGALLWLWFCYLAVTKYAVRNPLVFFTLLFLLLNSILIGLARSGMGVELALSSRYRLVSLLALGMCLISFFELHAVFLAKWKVVPAGIAAGFFFLYLVFLKFDTAVMAARRDNLVTWLEHGRCYYPDQERARSIMDKAVQHGIYQPPVVNKKPTAQEP